MAIDFSTSKTADDVLKSAALFALAAAILARVQLLRHCSSGLDVRSQFGLALVAVFLFALACKLLIVRIRELYPWIFSGPEWSGKVAYIVMIAALAVLLRPTVHVLLPLSAMEKEYECSGEDAPEGEAFAFSLQSSLTVE